MYAWYTILHYNDIICSIVVSSLLFTFFFVLLWGIGVLTYGLVFLYLGVSLVSSIILGLCMVFGALIPSIYYNFSPQAGKDTISMMLGSNWGLTVLGGLVICIIGIILCGKAGTMKEREYQIAKKADPEVNKLKTEYKFTLGLFVSIVSGILSACFIFGLDAGKPMWTVAYDL